MARRPGKRQRESARRRRSAALVAERVSLDRDAAGLPTSGPIADLVVAIGAELDLCVAVDFGSYDAAPILRPYGEQAFRLVGSIRGMRAVCHKAAGLDGARVAARTDMLDKAWDGIGDERGVWVA